MARRGWSKGSLVMGCLRSLWGRLATCAAVGYRRRTAANEAVGRLTIGRSLPSCPTTWLNSLAPRDGPFQSGDEVQLRRGVSEYLLVLAVERIAQVAVSGHAAAKGVIQVDAHVGESGIPEQSVACPQVGLFVKRASAEVAVEIGGEPSAGEGGDHIPGVLGTARQLLSD